jgi:hypothetical protein
VERVPPGLQVRLHDILLKQLAYHAFGLFLSNF